MSYQIGEQRRSWISKENLTEQQVRVTITGTMPLNDLIAYLAEQGVDLSRTEISGATVGWVEPASAETVAERRRHERERAQRRQEWERSTYATLWRKFGGVAPPEEDEGEVNR